MRILSKAAMLSRFDAVIERYLNHPIYSRNPKITPERYEIALSEMRMFVRSALDTRDYYSILRRFGRDYGVQIFSVVAHDLSDEEYWPMLADVWSGVEKPGWYIRTLSRFLRSERPGREIMTSSPDSKTLAAMGDPISVFRGVPPRGRAGWSWTVRYETAVEFATKFHTHRGDPAHVCRCGGVVIQGSVAKHNVIAYLDQAQRPGEAEIVADPKHVTVTARRKVTAADAEEFATGNVSATPTLQFTDR